jgi:hypothetical protein
MYRVMSTVNIVPKEYEVCVWCIPRNSEQLQQVVELTVNITNNGYWGWHVVHVLTNTKQENVQNKICNKFDNINDLFCEQDIFKSSDT